jgi:hypothetical protein
VRRLLAIARLTVRAAIRFRVFTVLMIALALIAIVLPLTVKSDGTLRGYVQILLHYALGLISVVLSLATIWIAAGSLSRDIDERQIHLVATKPVARWQIWLGKWLGVVWLNGVLLLFACAVVYALLLWNGRPGRWSPEEVGRLRAEVLTARRVVEPDLPDIETLVDQAMEERRQAGDLPPDIPPEEVRNQMRAFVLGMLQAVGQREGIGWTFSGLPTDRSDQTFQIRYQLLFAEPTPSGTVLGLWRVGSRMQPRQLEIAQSATQEAGHTLTFPGSLIEPDGTLALEYYNVDEYPTTVIFPVEDGVQVLAPAGGFAGNYARSVLLVWMRLALLAALALACASVASFPVAAFASMTLFLVAVSSGFLRTIAGQQVIFGGGHHGAAAEPTFIDTLFRVILGAVLFVVSNLQGYNPIGDLSVGRLVGWDWVARGFFIMLLLHGGLLAAAGILAFQRRELATARG